MDDQELLHLLHGLLPRPIHVCRIDPPTAGCIGATTGAVWLSKDNADKIAIKHRDIQIQHFQMLPIVLRYGYAVHDHHNGLMFAYADDVIFGTCFRAAVKVTASTTEMYLTSFHKLSPSEFRRLRRRALREGKLVRELKR